MLGPGSVRFARNPNLLEAVRRVSGEVVPIALALVWLGAACGDIVATVNHRPSLVPPGDFVLLSGERLTVALRASDPDGDAIAYALVSAPEGAELSGEMLTWTPGASDVGEAVFVVSATDDGDPPLVDYVSFTATVSQTTPVANRRPQLVPPSDLTVSIGDAVSVELLATDPDGDSLTYALESGPGGAALVEGRVQWVPAAGQAGSHGFLVSATDDGTPALTDYAAFTVTVAGPPLDPVNHPPVLIPPADQEVALGSALSITLVYEDVDEDTVTPAIESGPSSASLDGDTLSWTPTATDVGSHGVLVSATDDGVPPLADYAGFTVTVVDPDAPGVNHPPNLAPPDDARLDAGDTLTVELGATDPDGDEVELILDRGPVDAALVGSTLTWAPQLADIGSHGFVVAATDDGVPPLTVYGAFTVTVEDPDVPSPNRPPHIREVPDQTAVHGTELSVALSATDPNPGDALTWEAIEVPDGAELADDGSTATLTWTPETADAGSHYAHLRVVDDGDPALFDDVLFGIFVEGPATGPPELTSTPDTAVWEPGSPYEVEFEAHDPDGVPIDFYAGDLPAGAVLSVVSSDSESTLASLAWTPEEAQAGVYEIPVYAVDVVTRERAVTTWTVEVRYLPRVDPLVVVAGGDDAVITTNLIGTYSATLENTPAGASWNADTGELSWSTTPLDFGIYDVTYTVTHDLGVVTGTQLVGRIAVEYVDEFDYTVGTFDGSYGYSFDTKFLPCCSGSMTWNVIADVDAGDGKALHSNSSSGADVAGRAFRILDGTAVDIEAVSYELIAEGVWSGVACGGGTGRLAVYDFAVTDPATQWPDASTVDVEPFIAEPILYPLPPGATPGYQVLTGLESTGAPTSELTLTLYHGDFSNICVFDTWWDRVRLTPHSQAPIEIEIDWEADCALGPAAQVVKASDLPAGTYRITALPSGATKFATENWDWAINCENLDAPTLEARSPTYPSAEDAFADLEAYSEDVVFAGGDLVCGIGDSYCADNRGSVMFRMEFLHW